MPSKTTIVTATSVSDAVDKVWGIYRDNEDAFGQVQQSMTQVLQSVEIHGLSVEESTAAYVHLRKMSGADETSLFNDLTTRLLEKN